MHCLSGPLFLQAPVVNLADDEDATVEDNDEDLQKALAESLKSNKKSGGIWEVGRSLLSYKIVVELLCGDGLIRLRESRKHMPFGGGRPPLKHFFSFFMGGDERVRQAMQLAEAQGGALLN
eukprot:854690-Pelagomonas_calceolata.AAC.1